MTFFRIRGDRRAKVLAVGVATLLLGACMKTEARSVTWDLSTSHTAEDVDWPDDRTGTQISVEPVERVDITFPGGYSIEAGDEVNRVWVQRDPNDEVFQVQVDFEPQSLDDALARAASLADEWNIPTSKLDEWADGRTAVDEPVNVAGEKTEGTDRVQPVVGIRNSFNDDRPAIVSATIVWTDV